MHLCMSNGCTSDACRSADTAAQVEKLDLKLEANLNEMRSQMQQEMRAATSATRELAEQLRLLVDQLDADGTRLTRPTRELGPLES